MRLQGRARRIKRELRSRILPWQYRSRMGDVQQFLDDLHHQQPPVSPVILFMPGISWDQQLTQRPQHLAKSLAAKGALVLYLEPEIQPDKAAITEIAPNLFWCNAPIQFFHQLRSPWVYLLTWSIDLSQQLDHPRLIYDLVDDLSAFEGDPHEIYANHTARLEQAQLVLVSANQLLPLTAEYAEKTLHCPNAVDFELFHQGSTKQVPPDIQTIKKSGRPLIGYSGAIARWFDSELLDQVTQLRPGYDFVLVGPDIENILEGSSLLERSNLYWLGYKAYAQIPAYTASFDIGTIPFRLNAITHATSPLKLFEYFASGKPVVSTNLHECQQYSGVILADGPEEFASCLDDALDNSRNQTFIDLVTGVARENTWEVRADRILFELNKMEADPVW